MYLTNCNIFSRMTEKILHAFEAGRRGKPDELDTGIANLISAYFLSVNPLSRFDIRVSGSYRNNAPLVRVSGELTASLLCKSTKKELSKIILQHYNKTHCTRLPRIQTEFNFKPQAAPLAENTLSGDSGCPLAVAYKNTPNHLPWERFLAVEIRDIIDQIYQNNGEVPPILSRTSGVSTIRNLRADGKIGVEAIYNGVNLDSLCSITIAAEHAPTLPVKELRKQLIAVIETYLQLLQEKYSVTFKNPAININPLGDWNEGGGWEGDEGSREAKPYRDGFATYGVIEDSFSGEDPTKPSATGSFLARHIAVKLVKQDFADFVRVVLIYTIGCENTGLNITTGNTGKLSQQELEKYVRKHFPLGIQKPIKLFGLRNPELYKKFAQISDYFHDPDLPWNI